MLSIKAKFPEDPHNIPLYSQRNPVLEWRANLFTLSHGRDFKGLMCARDIAFETKLRNIARRGRETGHKAGYDPAGAGSPWYSIGPRNVNGRVKALAVHPTDVNTVYAGAAAGGVWKTTDGGQTWNPLWDMQESLAVGALAVAPSSPDTVYAGTGEWTPGWILTYGGAGVFVSTNGGTTWSQRAAINSRRISRLLVHPTNPQQLWTCGDSGLEKSTDGGVSWTILRGDTVTDAVLDPSNPDIVYIAVANNGFYKSVDSGATFTLLPGSPAGITVSSFPQVAIGKSGSHGTNFVVVAMGASSVQTSIDGGNTFTATSADPPGGTYVGWGDVIAVAPDDENVLIWGGISLNISADGGATWTSKGVHADQHAAVFAPSNSNVVYFANDGGVWRSDDKGTTVNKVSNGLVITQFYNINFWPSYSNVLGGGAQDNGTILTTGGLSWSTIFGGDGGWVLIDPTDPHIIYAESQNGNLAKSVDGGNSWAATTSGITGTAPWEGVLTMDPNDHLRIFYGTNVVLRSIDGLATAWTPVSQTLVGSVTAIAVDPTNSSRIFAGTNAGTLYRSDDGGNSQPWAEKTGTLPSRLISSVAVAGNVIMVSLGGLTNAASSQTVFRSTDGGDNWTDMSGDLPNVVGNGIAIDPSNSNTWYLATDTGVFRTTNGGVHWDAFDNGIPNVPCSGLVVDPSLKILYCSTFGRGAYKLDITPGVTKQDVDLYVRDDDIDTGERFPSPSGIDDPFIPLPGTANFWMSPDIKLNHAPVFTPAGVFDGVDFDMTLQHQDPYRGQSNRFYVQVHNRGWKPTNNVRVRAFIAEAATGLPNLPNALVPPNFDVPIGGAWTPVGTTKNIPQLIPNRPSIVFWDFVIPATEATHSCCLMVVSSDENTFNDGTTDIAQLIQWNKQVSLKNLHIVDPGPGGMPPKLQGIDFHNPTGTTKWIGIVIRPSGFSAGRIGLLLPKVTISDLDKQTRGVKALPLAPGDTVGTWYNRGGNRKTEELLQRRFLACDRTRIFEFDSNAVSKLCGIEIEAGKTVKAVLVSTLNNSVYIDGPSRLEILQLLDGKVIGGATFQYGYDIPPPGPPCRRIRVTADSIEWPRCKNESCLHGHCAVRFLLARTTIENGSDRISERLLLPGAGKEDVLKGDHRGPKETIKNTILFDGVVREGESLSLAIFEIHTESAKENELYNRQFDGDLGIRSWLGEYLDTGKHSLTLKYGIDEIADNATGGETD